MLGWLLGFDYDNTKEISMPSDMAPLDRMGYP